MEDRGQNMDETTSAKAGLLLRLSALGAREGDIAMVREALFANTILEKPKRNSNLEGSALKHQQDRSYHSPEARGSAANEGLRQYFQREFSKQALDAEIRAYRRPSVVSEQVEEFKSEVPDEMIEKVDSWFEFDIFQFANKVENEGGVLVRMGEILLDRHGFISRYSISRGVLRNFLTSLQVAYNNDIAYHNAIHGADVAQSMSHFIVYCGLSRRGDDLMRFAAIVSALGHDVGHPGYTNRYLIETRSELAMLYNDRSPLENMHASKLFSIMWAKDGRNDITAKIGNHREVSRFRKLCIGMILATDNAYHEETVSKLKNDPDDESVYKAALHAADLGGGGKTISLAHNWAGRVLQEFFRQGDAERVLGLYPVLPGMDRNNPMPKSVYQGAFIKQICLPLYMALDATPGLSFSVQVRALEYNARHWVGDTSETHPSRLKETRSFSLQKQGPRSMTRDSNGESEGRARKLKKHGTAGEATPTPPVEGTRTAFSPTLASDVRLRLNLSPRANNEDLPEEIRRQAIRDAVLRSRAAKVPNSGSQSLTSSRSPRHSPPLPVPRFFTPGRETDFSTSASSAFRNARKNALRGEDETLVSTGERRRKDAANRQRSGDNKPQPLD